MRKKHRETDTDRATASSDHSLRKNGRRGRRED